MLLGSTWQRYIANATTIIGLWTTSRNRVTKARKLRGAERTKTMEHSVSYCEFLAIYQNKCLPPSFSQNYLSGLEYIHPTTGAWTTVAPDHIAVVWGWCSAIPSGDKIRATRHRVQTTLPGTRRLSAVLFSAPDINTILRPLNGNGAGFCDEIRNGQVGQIIK